MTAKQIIFDDLFRDENGIYIIDEKSDLYSYAMKAQAEHLIEVLINKYPRLSSVEVELINNLELNAAATKVRGEEEYFIGIFAGLYFKIQTMFLKMFSLPDVLPYLGNVSCEDSARISGYGATTDVIFPVHESRREWANVYAFLVINFVLLHEIGHVVRGHIGLVVEKGSGSVKLIEQPSKKQSLGIEKWVLQTLEMDADSFATNHIFLQALFKIQNKAYTDKLDNELYKDFESFTVHLYFALYSYFRVCGLQLHFEPADKMISHPPPSLRMAMVGANLAVLLSENGYDPVEISRGRIANSTKQAEEAFSAVNGTPSKIDVFIDNLHDTDDYRRQITGNWNEVYDMLLPFAFGDLPQKNQNPTPEKRW